MGTRFKAGDRVRFVESGYMLPTGKEGTVLLRDIDDTLCVEFDGWDGGHQGPLSDGAENRWWCDDDELKLIARARQDNATPGVSSMYSFVTAGTIVVYRDADDEYTDPEFVRVVASDGDKAWVRTVQGCDFVVDHADLSPA